MSTYPPRRTFARAGRARQGARGQSVVEFALVLPLLLILLMATIDFARVYTTMMSIESAAREAADFGTTLGAGKWQSGPPMDTTVAEMQRRACVAASDLPDYADPDGDPVTGCANPTFAYCMTASVGGPCGPVDPTDGCDIPTRTEPCTVTVTLTHDFSLFAPLSIEFLGITVGFPSSITIRRDSTFAMTDIDLAPAAPGP
ncbi:MAG: TadE/TadG family type IV pilus assembly protein [Candidatus Limnocylindria bacterium]